MQSQSTNLASYAVQNSAGRVYEEPGDEHRNPFQRDRDRIVHSRAFRRLQAKTQVFVAYFGDHYRDRMTHSLEVSLVARDISRRLKLNEDLAEAIALAHDLGHTPFGHAGEEALNKMMEKYNSFYEHNQQSRRIVAKLEKSYPNFDGLNLTKEILDGLLKHNPKPEEKLLDFAASPHLEAQITDKSDEIAYTNHDLDDGLRSGLITVEQLEKLELWREAADVIDNRFKRDTYINKPEGPQRRTSRIISVLISQMISNLYNQTLQNIEEKNVKTVDDIRKQSVKLAHFSDDFLPKIKEIRSFLMTNFYNHPQVNEKVQKGQRIIQALFSHYMDKPEHLPQNHRDQINIGEPLHIVVKDYIAGMTDHFAEEQFNRLT
ncbi:deoxyguanosinetriphosphate triphosphohydrolase [Candidatus Peregrinibacteria bacterium]|nr:deoxyguanosinetriphosphate triphosphohydrolase [Candidatus Peregrinibacteria bacterium]